MLRFLLNFSRSITAFGLRLVMAIGLAFTVGTVFFDLGNSWADVTGRAALLFFVVGFLTFTSISALPELMQDIKIFTREKLNGWYGTSTFVVANTLASLPFIFIVAMCASVVLYFLAGLRSGGGHFIKFAINLFLSLTVVESLLFPIGALVGHFLAGIAVSIPAAPTAMTLGTVPDCSRAFRAESVPLSSLRRQWSSLIAAYGSTRRSALALSPVQIGSGVLGIYMLVCGFFQVADNLPDPVWKYPLHYVAFHTYSFRGFMNDQFRDTDSWLCPPDGTGTVPPLELCSQTGNNILDRIYFVEDKSWGFVSVPACLPFCACVTALWMPGCARVCVLGAFILPCGIRYHMSATRWILTPLFSPPQDMAILVVMIICYRILFYLITTVRDARATSASMLSGPENVDVRILTRT